MTLESSFAIDGARSSRRASTSSRFNNIAELRLLFALCVVLSHAVQLAQASDFDIIRVVMNSEVAVQGFFILSGYLVFGSYDRLRNVTDFYLRRLLRIYPAYVVAVFLFLLLGIGQAALFGHDLRWEDVPPYLAANLTTLNFLYPTVGGVFANNAVEHINGALWSIKVELMFYTLVPFLYWTTRWIPVALLAILLVVSGALWWPVLQLVGSWVGIDVPISFRFQLPGQLHFFGLGIALFARSKGRLTFLGLVSVATFAVIALAVLGETRDALHALGLVTVIGAVSAAPQIRNPFHSTDISYGVYLCHFPTIQLLLASGAAQWPFSAYIATVLVLVIGYGVLSWKFVERPALLKSRGAGR